MLVDVVLIWGRYFTLIVEEKVLGSNELWKVKAHIFDIRTGHMAKKLASMMRHQVRVVGDKHAPCGMDMF